VSLDGLWRAATAEETLRRAYPDPEFDDGTWEPLAVPGHWSSSPAFADSTGPVLHRHRFATPAPFAQGADDPAGDRRTWLVLDGVFYTSDVWLDGTYVGDTEGYFIPHAFEVTAAMAARSEHTLAVEVACRPEGDPTHRPAAGSAVKRTLLGAYDPSGAGPSPGGIWRPVRLEQSGPVRIAHLRVTCTEATEEAATVAVRAILDSAWSTTAELRTAIAPAGEGGPEVDDRRSWPLAQGENRVEWTVTVPSPRLWWPRALGDQPLYDLAVAVHVPGTPAGDDATAAADQPSADQPSADQRSADQPSADQRSDVRWRRLGLRTISAEDWIFSVNGERIFLKGAIQEPARALPAQASAADIAGDVRLAVDAGLDLLRLRAHVARPELYDAADAAGLLLWQDMPLQGAYHRGVRREARRQARELVDQLAQHPSVALWCAHDEPVPLAEAGARRARWGTRNRLVARTVAAHVLPSWNRTILDRSVRAVLSASDGTRPVVAHAGVLPHPPRLSGTDSHLSFGWYHHDERDLTAALRLWPRLARFVGSFGVPSVPGDAGVLDPQDWPALDWEAAAAHGLEKDVFDRVVPPAAYDSFAGWRQATQEYQARVVRHHIEALRRLKYRPCGGFALAGFADGVAGVSPAVLDHRRGPKLAYAALAAACAPVAVVADRPPSTVAPGQALSLDVHVINDRRIALDDMMLTAYLRWGESSLSNPPPRSGSTTTAHRWRWCGDVPPDDCIRIGTVQAVAPDGPGPLVLDLRLSPRSDPDNVVAANGYTADVRRS
jgi:beta-mannosidase